MENGNFICYKEDQPVKCTDELNIGTKLIPQCNATYKMDGKGTESYKIMCQDDGKWIGALPKCIKSKLYEKPYTDCSFMIMASQENGNLYEVLFFSETQNYVSRMITDKFITTCFSLPISFIFQLTHIFLEILQIIIISC